MPITLSIDRERRVIYSALHGIITQAEFLRHAGVVKSNPQFDPSFAEILDFRGVTDFQVSEEALSRLAATPSIYNRESKHVVVVQKGPIERLAKTYQRAAADTRPNFVVVRTAEQAYRSLQDSE